MAGLSINTGLTSEGNRRKLIGQMTWADKQLDILAEKYGDYHAIPESELIPIVEIGKAAAPTLRALAFDEKTQRGFTGQSFGGGSGGSGAETRLEWSGATVDVTGQNDMSYQAGRLIAISGGVIAGGFQNIGDGLIGAGKLLKELNLAQMHILFGGDSEFNRETWGYSYRKESFENVKQYAQAMREVARDPYRYFGDAVGHTVDKVSNALNVAERSTELGDWFLYGAAVGHVTVDVANLTVGGVGAVKSLGSLGGRLVGQTAANLRAMGVPDWNIRFKANLSSTPRSSVTFGLAESLESLEFQRIRTKEPATFSADAPYVHRYDPASPGRPDPKFSLDSTTFENPVGRNAQGFPRDAGEFWKQWKELNPDSLSKNNKYLIENYDRLKVSPRVDKIWIDSFPEHGNYMGDVLIHHHVNHGQYTIPVPGKTHVGSGGIWHL